MSKQDNGMSSLMDRVTRRIAPVWPLDSFVAVNPYWGFAEHSLPEAAATLQGAAGERVFMDRRWYAEQIQLGKLSLADIQQAAEDLGLSSDEEEWQDYLRQAPEPPLRLLTLAELMDRQGRPAISQFVVEQISHFLAAYYDRGQSLWSLPKSEQLGLFASWRQYTLRDRSLHAIGLGGARRDLLALPSDAESATAWAMQTLDLPPAIEETYLLVLLKTVGGWASWCRYLLWQAELQGGTHQDLPDLLTIRLVWEALLRAVAPAKAQERWRQQLRGWVLLDKGEDLEHARRSEVLLRASEMVFRRQVAARIRHKPSRKAKTGIIPEVQAAFCIDVRSEVYRRHLESLMPTCETIGFAGFFGVLLDYRRAGDPAARTQSPVLLNPAVHVEEQAPESIVRRRLRRLRRGAEWKLFKLSASSCFSFVETAGISYVARLLADSMGWHQPSQAPDDAGLTADERARLQCVLPTTLSSEERVGLAEFVLRGLGLTQRIAPIVLLVGHGSSTTNNPHRAGLDCGACAGQTGEVNAKAAANLLNDPQVRAGLLAKGWALDPQTRFVPALHDTTTDHVQLLEEPAGLSSQSQFATLQKALEEASVLTQMERMLRLDGDVREPLEVARNTQFRGRDWSQVRPEWALAGNAAFIAAPRWRTREMNLGGRAFLHDYEAREDQDFALLTLIMTAPLVVANWINLQYYASTVDNQRQGCGNKVLHNVVGGTIGVLEGNGGDLRIGLAEQSIRDSNGALQHEPLRLSAFIEAPAEAMDQVIAGNEPLRNLVENRWLTVLQIGEDGTLRERRAAGQWVQV